MKLLEVTAALRRANKQDLFSGDLNHLKGQQWIRENATVFYRSKVTGEIQGPHKLDGSQDFTELYSQMLSGMIGVIAPIPNVISNELIFDLVLREASREDFIFRAGEVLKNKIYYIYADKKLTGPFYTDNSTMIETIENLTERKVLFVPNERQHFRKKEFKKAA